MTGRDFARRRARVLWRGRSERATRRALAHLAREAGAAPIYAGRKLVAHVMPDGFTICEKRRYHNLDAAQAELSGVEAFAHLHEGRKLPVRAYPCPHCMGWHTTSQHK